MNRWIRILAGLCLLLGGWPALADERSQEVVVDVRGPKLVLFGDPGLKQELTTKSKAEALALLDGGPAVVARHVAENASAWLINLGGNDYWVKKSQVRLERRTLKLSCDQRLSGSSVGATRGIGESCK